MCISIIRIEQHIFKDQHLILTFENEIGISIGVIYSLGPSIKPMLANFKKMYKYIERTSFGLQTDRQMQNKIYPLFSKRSMEIKTIFDIKVS